MKYGYYDYHNNKGYSVTRKQNILSAHNKAELLYKQEVKSTQEILKLHSLCIEK